MTCKFTLEDALEIQGFCERQLSHTPINYFIYTRIYADMSAIEVSSNIDWHRHIWERNLGYTNMLRLKQGMLYWPSVDGLIQVAHMAKSKFNIDHRYDITRKQSGYIEVFGFGTPVGCDDVLQTYFNRFNDLIEFGDLFIDQFAAMIKIGRASCRERV